jgi:hypothetical protein
VGVSGYNVYNGQTLLATATGTSYMVTGLTHRTTYSFTVKDDSQNLSGASAPISVTTGIIATHKETRVIYSILQRIRNYQQLLYNN